jgi:hypothetical protein
MVAHKTRVKYKKHDMVIEIQTAKLVGPGKRERPTSSVRDLTVRRRSSYWCGLHGDGGGVLTDCCCCCCWRWWCGISRHHRFFLPFNSLKWCGDWHTYTSRSWFLPRHTYIALPWWTGHPSVESWNIHTTNGSETTWIDKDRCSTKAHGYYRRFYVVREIVNSAVF